MDYLKLIHDDRGQNSFACFRPFVKSFGEYHLQGDTKDYS